MADYKSIHTGTEIDNSIELIQNAYSENTQEWNLPILQTNSFACATGGTISQLSVPGSASINSLTINNSLTLGQSGTQTGSYLYGNITLTGSGTTLNIMGLSTNFSNSSLYLDSSQLHFNDSNSKSLEELTGAESWTGMEHFTTNYQYINSLPFYSENMTAYSFLMACPNYTSFITTVNEHGFSDCPYTGTFYGLAQVMTGSANYRIMILWQNSGLNNYICTRNTNQSSVTWRKLSVTNA